MFTDGPAGRFHIEIDQIRLVTVQIRSAGARQQRSLHRHGHKHVGWMPILRHGR